MTRARTWSIVLALLWFAGSASSLAAIGPWAVMVYGGPLRQPVLLRPSGPEDFPAFGLLWWKAGPYDHPTRTVRDAPEVERDLADRPHVDLAIFWGQYDPDELAPEHASQHGRLYLPTASQPATVVVTSPDMQKKARPIPGALREFTAVWTLNPDELSTLRTLGFPGL